MKNVVVISAYGRGSFLAYCLKQNGLNVELWDIGRCMPSLSSAEQEGPFGVFVPDFLSDKQKAFLYGDIFFVLPSGFSVLNSDGPVEFQGPLRDFLLKKRQDFRLCHSILSGSFNLKKPGDLDREKEQQNLWLYRFVEEISNSYISPLFTPYGAKRKQLEPALSQNKGQGLHGSIFPFGGGEYILRESSQRYFDNLGPVLEQEGIKFLSFSSDLAKLDQALFPSSGNGLISRGGLSSWGFSNKHRLGLFGSSFQKTALVWTLSGLETARHFPKYMPWLFPKWKEPVHIWHRFSLSWKCLPKTLPGVLFIAPDKVFWSKKKPEDANFLVLKKNPYSTFLDLWVLCPYSVRENLSVISHVLSSALNRLGSLFPGTEDLKGFVPEGNRQKYFVLYKNKYKSKTLSSQKFLGKKAAFGSVFHLNPESAGKGDAYALMLKSQSLAHQLSGKH